MSPLATVTVEFSDGLTIKMPVLEKCLREKPAAPIELALETRDAEEFATA